MKGICANGWGYQRSSHLERSVLGSLQQAGGTKDSCCLGMKIQRTTEPGFLMLAVMVGEVAYILLAATMWHSDDWELPNMWCASWDMFTCYS